MRSFDLREAGFGLDTELTALLLRGGIRPFEVPVSYYSRSHAQGKKITWRDAAGCVWVLLRVRFRSRSSLTRPMSEASTRESFGHASAVSCLPHRRNTEDANSWLADDERDVDATAAV